jgi:hypothetical protein
MRARQGGPRESLHARVEAAPRLSADPGCRAASRSWT